MLRMIVGTCVILMVLSTAAFGQDTIQGNYEGKFTGKKSADLSIAVKVVGEGTSPGQAVEKYRAVVEVTKNGKTAATNVMGSVAKGKLAFDGNVAIGDAQGGACPLKATIAKGGMKGKISGKGAPGAFTLTRVEKKPPSMGAKPPAGAIVLLDGKNLDAWKPAEIPWKIIEGGAMEVGKGSLVSKEEFGDHKLHLEFRTPYLPNKRGQARGNSGVYILGRYEVQVLDSFGLPAKDNECGGIYKKATPKVNATLPPTEWQTYDITFRAPKWDDGGKKVKNARINVEHNGIVIHDNIELDGGTPGGVGNDEAKAGPLLLQDHGCKVEYRNIWVQKL